VAGSASGMNRACQPLGRSLHTGGHGAVDDHPSGIEVDVLPAQRQQLAEAQAGVGSKAEQLGVLGVLSRSPCNLVGFDVRGFAESR
jgi:hypothetical protein